MSHVCVHARTGEFLEALAEQLRALVYVGLVRDERRHGIHALVLSAVLAMAGNRAIGEERPLRCAWRLPCLVPVRLWEFGSMAIDCL